MKNTLETRLGVFFALALIATVILFEMIGGLDVFQRGRRIRAQFNNVQDLKVGDGVKMAGVPIGRVDAIQLANNKVEVVLRLFKPDGVKTDSRASVQFVGLMGQNFVSVDFGSPTAPVAAENALIETVERGDLNSLMTKLEGVAAGVDNLTKSFSGEGFNNLLGPFTDFLKENRPRLTGILTNMQTVSAQIAQGQGTVGKMIMDDSLYASAMTTVSNLNGLGDDLRLTLADAKAALSGARSVVDSVQAGEGSLGRLVKDETLYRETTTAMTQLREILQKINRGDGSVGKLVNEESLFNNAKLTLQKLEKATEGLEDQGPLSILGTVVGRLF